MYTYLLYFVSRCRSSRKQCDKGTPCRNCSENNRKCLYAKEFPYSNLSQEQQAMILERLLYDTKDKYAQLKLHYEKPSLGSSSLAAGSKSKQRLGTDVYEWARQQTMTPLIGITHWPQRQQEQQHHHHPCVFERNPKRLALSDDLDKDMASFVVFGLSDPSEFSIDIARSMISVEEVDTLIAMYNDCYTFSALPDFITPHLDDNGDYDLLLSSVMTLMCTHAVQCHTMKIDNHQHLSHVFYHYTRALLTTRMEQQADIMCLHTLFNLMLFETENGYSEQAALSRHTMTAVIESLHHHYPSMSVWQQSLLRHLLWAVHTSDTSRHDLQLPPHIIGSAYMQLEKQRPSEHPAQPVDRLKEEYIYYRCRLADIIRRIYMTCYHSNKSSSSAVPGQEIKVLDEHLWDLYHDLPKWVVNGQPLESVNDGTTALGVDPCVHSRSHPACERTLDQVWIRRLRYQFLMEWHSTFVYLYQPFLQPAVVAPDLLQQLVLVRCFEHGKYMVDVMAQWVDDVEYSGCYCLPILRPLLLVSHVHRSLLKTAALEGVRQNSYALILKLFSVIRVSTLYPLYKDTIFNWNLQADDQHYLSAMYPQGGYHGNLNHAQDGHGDSGNPLYAYTATS